MVDYFFSAKKFNSSNGRVHSQTNFKLALLLFVLLWLLCGDCGSTTQLSSRYTDWELEFYRTIDWVVRHEGAGKVVETQALESQIRCSELLIRKSPNLTSDSFWPFWPTLPRQMIFSPWCQMFEDFLDPLPTLRFDLICGFVLVLLLYSSLTQKIPLFFLFLTANLVSHGHRNSFDCVLWWWLNDKFLRISSCVIILCLFVAFIVFL